MLKTLRQVNIVSKRLNTLGVARFNQEFKNNEAKAEKIDKKGSHYWMPHRIWQKDEIHQVDLSHKKAYTFGDKFSHLFIQSLRIGFDYMSGYKSIIPGSKTVVTEKTWLNRVLFLETVAGVPGFVAGMHRHLTALRKMKRDNGWIHTLLEEAENERVHLQTFLLVKQPSILFRTGVILAQVWYVSLFSILYAFVPRVCHRIVGYLEEEAVKTYTHMIEEILREGSPINHWKTKDAPLIAKDYWQLGDNATLLDVVYAVRKDEEHHKDVNHFFADDYTQSLENPIPPGK